MLLSYPSVTADDLFEFINAYAGEIGVNNYFYVDGRFKLTGNERLRDHMGETRSYQVTFTPSDDTFETTEFTLVVVIPVVTPGTDEDG